jgi:hypothetical protein
LNEQIKDFNQQIGLAEVRIEDAERKIRWLKREILDIN